MPGSIPLAVSYGLFAIFVVAFLVRSLRIARLPLHLRWELAPVPKEGARSRYGGSYLEEFEWWRKPRKESHVAELAYMLEEIVFLKALWVHNRRLWWFSYPFHMGLYLLVLCGAGGVLASGLAAAGASETGWAGATVWMQWAAGVGYVLTTAGALGLVASRLADVKLRIVTTPIALFNLMLVLAVAATGLLAVITVRGAAGHAVAFGTALFEVAPPPRMPAILAAHLWLAMVFLAYLPFSQMMHFVAKYFTYHQVRWDDRPLEPGGAMEREVKKLLSQPVTWSAPHVGADGRRSWVDIATEEVPR